jgi:hypothetical protein
VTDRLYGAGEPPPGRGVAAVRGAEQDDAGGLAGAQAPADVRRRSRPIEARDRGLTDLLAQREPVDLSPGGRELTLVRRRCCAGVTLGAVPVRGANGSTEEQRPKRYAGQRGKAPPPDLAPGVCCFSVA